jgi:hypothetical protein
MNELQQNFRKLEMTGEELGSSIRELLSFLENHTKFAIPLLLKRRFFVNMWDSPWGPSHTMHVILHGSQPASPLYSLSESG